MGVRLVPEGKEGWEEGPVLDLELMPGESALVLHPSADVLRDVIRVAMRQREPSAGTVSWGPGARQDGHGLWARLRFNLGVGLVHRNLSLVPARTVLEHLAVFFSYHHALPPRGIRLKCYGVLRSVGVCGRDWGEMSRTASERLPGRLSRLGLYALALAKRPWLFILQSPADLGRDFATVWSEVERQRRQGAAVLAVDDARRPAYSGAGFTRIVELGPVPSVDRNPVLDRVDDF
jgi:hypothetical protein